VIELRCETRLVHERGHRLRPVPDGSHELQRDQAPQDQVAREVHLPHAAPTERAQNAELPDHGSRRELGTHRDRVRAGPRAGFLDEGVMQTCRQFSQVTLVTWRRLPVGPQGLRMPARQNFIALLVNDGGLDALRSLVMFASLRLHEIGVDKGAVDSLLRRVQR
jgi:hypothetical protein